MFLALAVLAVPFQAAEPSGLYELREHQRSATIPKVKKLVTVQDVVFEHAIDDLIPNFGKGFSICVLFAFRHQTCFETVEPGMQFSGDILSLTAAPHASYQPEDSGP